MTTRRDALLALPFLCATSCGHAQAPKSGQPKRLGVLSLGEDSKTPRSQRPLYMALRKKGWMLGDNLLVEPAFADWKPERLPALADELLRKRVDVIISSGPDATLTAARATRSIPIIFDGVLLPVEQGLIDSFGRPGRNLTGQALYTGLEVSIKRLEFLREIVPAAKRLSWLWSADLLAVGTLAGGRIDVAAMLEAAAKGLGFESRFHPIRTPLDAAAAFDDISTWRAQAVTAGGLQINEAGKRVAELALRHRLPMASIFRGLVEAGGLLSYGISDSEQAVLEVRRVEIVDRILRGALPADIPVERPSRYELVVNLKTAKALGLAVPQSLLARVDEVIQ